MVGGGIIGLCSAVSLVRGGRRVEIIDMGPPASGTSIANAGWVTVALAEPVPGPGIVAKSLGWALRGNSPVSLSVALNPARWRWLFSFWRRCNDGDFWKGIEALAGLSREAYRAFDELKRAGIDFEEHRRGMLVLCSTQSGLAEARRSLTLVGSAVETLAWQPLGVDELRSFEPRVSSSVLGGFFVPTERHVEPRSLSAGLRAWLRESDVEVSVAERVVGFRHSRGSVAEVVTTRRRIRPKTVLVCAGSWTAHLVRFLGGTVPIVGGRGYVLDYRRPAVELQRPMYLYEAKIAVSPFDDRTRVTGAMELGAQKLGVSHRRVAGIARQLGDYIRGWPPSLEGVEVESGLRPMTPDGLPVIGAVPGFRNAYLASGHAMLGVTLGPATGAAVALTIENGRAPESLRQLAPDRF